MNIFGAYGLMTYTVTRRTHELALRIALGAGRRDVLRLTVGQTLRMTLLGLGFGLAIAYVAHLR